MLRPKAVEGERSICDQATIGTESGACLGNDGFRPMGAVVVLDGAGFSWLAPGGLIARGGSGWGPGGGGDCQGRLGVDAGSRWRCVGATCAICTNCLTLKWKTSNGTSESHRAFHDCRSS